MLECDIVVPPILRLSALIFFSLLSQRNRVFGANSVHASSRSIAAPVLSMNVIIDVYVRDHAIGTATTPTASSSSSSSTAHGKGSASTDAVVRHPAPDAEDAATRVSHSRRHHGETT